LLALGGVARPAAAAETLSQLITDSRVLALDAASTTRQRFSDAQITEFLNQGQREALTATRCLRQSQVYQLVPGTTYYALPSNYLTMERLTIGYKYLQEMSPAALDGRSRAWEAASGYPTYYFINWSSPTLVGFAPWPAQSTDTDTIKMEYDVQATDLVNSSDLPFNGVPQMYDYHHALAYFAAAMMSAIEGQMGRQQSYQGVYTGMVGALSKRCLERPNYLPSATWTQ
jgi:hypothetical protein